MSTSPPDVAAFYRYVLAAGAGVSVCFGAVPYDLMFPSDAEAIRLRAEFLRLRAQVTMPAGYRLTATPPVINPEVPEVVCEVERIP